MIIHWLFAAVLVNIGLQVILIILMSVTNDRLTIWCDMDNDDIDDDDVVYDWRRDGL